MRSRHTREQAATAPIINLGDIISARDTELENDPA
jgi:hypothetical protein